MVVKKNDDFILKFLDLSALLGVLGINAFK